MFGNLGDSSLATLTVTSLGHVTEMLSPAFDANTLFYEVNVTSLTYTVDADASSEVATGGSGWKSGTRHLHCALDSSRVPEYGVIVSARDGTTATYVAHAFFQPVPCDCYADTCNAFDGSCVCHVEWYGSSCNVHCPGSLPWHDRDMCDTASS